MQIDVATGGDLELSFEPEVAMVKAALLYGDQVSLMSPTFAEQEGLNQWGPDTADVVEDVRRRLGEKPWREFVLLRRKLLLNVDFDEVLSSAYRRLQDKLAALTPINVAALGNLGINEQLRSELDRAQQAGLLDLDALEGEAPSMDFDRLVVRRLREKLADARFPLFDWRGWAIATNSNEKATPGERTSTKTSQGLEVALAARLLGRLEAFPFAPMDEILDLRERLTDSRVRFHAAVIKAAEELEHVTSYEDLDNETQQLYRRDIAPAIAELDESVQDVGARAALRRAGVALTASLGVAGVGALTTSEVVGGAVVPLGMAAAQEWKHRTEAEQKCRQNGYFFLWQAHREIEASA